MYKVLQSLAKQRNGPQIRNYTIHSSPDLTYFLAYWWRIGPPASLFLHAPLS